MHRFTVSIEDDLYNEIDNISEKNKHSLSVTVSLLLHQAVKERNRKRKNAKEVLISNNPSDVHKDNGQ